MAPSPPQPGWNALASTRLHSMPSGSCFFYLGYRPDAVTNASNVIACALFMLVIWYIYRKCKGNGLLYPQTLASGTGPPSTTAIAPTLPASADPLSSEMQEMTSDGSRRCQLANVCLELAPTVTEKTWSSGSSDCRSDRNMSACVSMLPMSIQTSRLTFVGEIIPKAEYELRRLRSVLFHKPLRDLALVDESWTDFKVGFASHHLHIVFLADRVLKMLLALSRLESTPFWICEPIMPGKSNLLGLNERSCPRLDTTHTPLAN